MNAAAPAPSPRDDAKFIPKELRSLHRTIVLGCSIMVITTWAVYIPLMVAESLPKHLTLFTIVVTPLMLAWAILSLTVVPGLGIRFGISGKSWCGLLLDVAYMLPPLIVLLILGFRESLQ